MNKAWLVSPQAVVAMLITYLLTMTLLFQQTQWWVLAVGVLCVAWRWAMLVGKGMSVAKSWRLLLTLVCIVLLASMTRQNGLLHTMVNLLLIGYGLKFIELNKRRDVLVLAMAGIVSIGVLFIFSQTIVTTVFSSLLVISNLTILVAVFAPSMQLSTQIKLALRTVGLSIPLVVVLFIVMPQLSPLWKMPTPKSAATGLADSMTPGDIAQLGQDASLAFSVTFDGERPSSDQLYWRALVMEHFDGRRWEQGESTKHWQRRLSANIEREKLTSRGDDAGISYQVIAKASQQSWLFGLALPTSRDQGIFETLDFTLYANKPLSSTKAYQVTSYPQLMEQVTLSQLSRAVNLRYPTASNLKTKTWVKSLRQKYDDQQFIDYVLNYFHKNNYSYTLTPPPLGADSVDEFLFSTQQGFCAHYASSFALIMRYAGIPSRIVAGYLGGEWNEDVGYLNVYQYDAHAWNEVWLEGRGWVRVDPTASVAPQRVQQGLAQSLDDQDSFLAESGMSLAKYRRIAWINNIRTQLANLDYYWSRWLLGYNKEKQNQLLERILGRLTPTKMLLFTLGCFAMVALWFWLNSGVRFKRLSATERVDKQYKRLIKASTRLQTNYANHMTPNQYGQAILAQRPDLIEQVNDVTTQYNQLKYVAVEVRTSDARAFKRTMSALLNKV